MGRDLTWTLARTPKVLGNRSASGRSVKERKAQRLEHPEPAEKFYRELAGQGRSIRLGMEASGHARWFERLLAELNIELWIGDAAKIRAKRVRKKKTDREDARHILGLLLKDDFPRSEEHTSELQS